MWFASVVSHHLSGYHLGPDFIKTVVETGLGANHPHFQRNLSRGKVKARFRDT